MIDLHICYRLLVLKLQFKHLDMDRQLSAFKGTKYNLLKPLSPMGFHPFLHIGIPENTRNSEKIAVVSNICVGIPGYQIYPFEPK